MCNIHRNNTLEYLHMTNNMRRFRYALCLCVCVCVCVFTFFFFPTAALISRDNGYCSWTVATTFDYFNPQISLFSNFFIKNWSHGTIHTFKNYFVTVFSFFSFSKISYIQTDPIYVWLFHREKSLLHLIIPQMGLLQKNVLPFISVKFLLSCPNPKKKVLKRKSSSNNL